MNGVRASESRNEVLLDSRALMPASSDNRASMYLRLISAVELLRSIRRWVANASHTAFMDRCCFDSWWRGQS